MGLFRRRGRWREIRANYRQLPPHEWTEDEHQHYLQTCSDEEYWADWEAWSRQTIVHPRIQKLSRQCLDVLRASAESTDAPDDPKEFACLLRIDDDTITEPVLLPGTVSGDEHAIFDLWMQPVDRDVRGSMHSHPDEHPYPSDADFELFAAHGEVHLILCRPYGPEDWRAYDHAGRPIALKVVD